MTPPQDEDNAYTHLILGTSLTHCILSASLCQSPTSNKVLQVDSNDYYGGENASLTLSQLESYLASLPSTSKAKVTFPAFEATGSGDGLPPQLKGLDRHYSLSLTPALLAAHGPALDALVRSKVAEYATFRLLQRTAVYTPEDNEGSAAASSSNSTLRPVPSSKEDVFKTPTSVLSLLDKRKLMKLLQWCATAKLDEDPTATTQDDAILSSARSSPKLWTFLTGGNQRLSPSLASAIAYGLCLSPDAHLEPALLALRRLQTHLRSTGKYGNAAYLVAQYGGAGELVQGYARAAAVRGATFVLGKGVERCEESDEKGGDGRQYFDVSLKDVDETFRCEKVVGSRKELEKLGLVQPPDASASSSRGGKATLQGLLLLDRGIQLPSPADAASSSSTSDTPQKSPSPIETALIVFPPQSLSLTSGKHNAVTVTALVLGEGTFCCPKGQYVVHFTAANLAGEDVVAAEELFEAAKRAMLGLARGSEVEWRPASAGAQKGEGEDGVATKDASNDVVPLMEAFWLSTDSGEDAIEVVSASPSDAPRPPASISSDAAASDTPQLLSTILDTSTQRAESLFYSLHGLTPEEAAAAAATRRSTRRRRRDAAEYRGRGGAGPEDEEEDEDEGEEWRDHEEEQEEVPLFFGGEGRRGGGDDDEEDEG